MHCPEPPFARGRFRSQARKVYTVDACAEHAHQLEQAKRI